MATTRNCDSACFMRGRISPRVEMEIKAAVERGHHLRPHRARAPDSGLAMTTLKFARCGRVYTLMRFEFGCLNLALSELTEWLLNRDARRRFVGAHHSDRHTGSAV
jgi:hypothetical protein